MELLLLGLIAMGIFGGNDSKKSKDRDKKRRREAREREERRRRYHESLGYYEHLYGQGHP